MLGILIGLVPIAFGITAFTRDGMLLTRSKKINGVAAKAIGVVCIVVGLVFVADGAVATWNFFRSIEATAKNNTTSIGARSAAKPADYVWVRHDCPLGQYSVLMPDVPTVEESPADPKIGKLGGCASLVEAHGRAYMAQCSRFSLAHTDVKQELDAARDNLIGSLEGERLHEEDLELAGHPGREVLLSLPDGTVMRSRYFIVDQDVFQVMAVVPRGQESSNETNEFFDSFRLLNAE